MYLKKMSKKNVNKLIDPLYSQMVAEGNWYYKMNENRTKARNQNGSLLITFMSDNELNNSLQSGEFTHVEI
jgi:hypothetical protein